MCFNQSGALYDEFTRLFESLFEQAEINLKLIRAIAKRRNGFSRDDLIKSVKMASGGSFNKRIRELEAAGFIQTFVPYGREKRDVFYRVIDEYCLFYLRWIEPESQYGHDIAKGYWQSKYHSPEWYDWAGYSFENICIKHVEKIRQALDIQHIGCSIATWKYLPKRGEKSDGPQVDLLFDRDDGVISLVEIKFSDKMYSIDKDYAKSLAKKWMFFRHVQKQKNSFYLFFSSMLTSGFLVVIWAFRNPSLNQRFPLLDDSTVQLLRFCHTYNLHISIIATKIIYSKTFLVRQ